MAKSAAELASCIVTNKFGAYEVVEKQEDIDACRKYLGLQTLGAKNLEMLEETVIRWALRLRRNGTPCWLTLLGKSGVGKTRCAKKVWRWYLV